MKPKVYLAKSNLCNPNQVMQIRSYLQQFDIDIVEFNGGNYTHKPLLECDYLIIIPSEIDELSKDKYIIGRGLYEQIYNYENINGENIFIVTNIENNNIIFKHYIEITQKDTKDWINFGYVIPFLKSETIDFSKLFKILNNKVKEYNIKTNINKYILLITH